MGSLTHRGHPAACGPRHRLVLPRGVGGGAELLQRVFAVAAGREVGGGVTHRSPT
jgi:hypothetical protein